MDKKPKSLKNKHLSTDSKHIRVYDIDHETLMDLKHSQGYTNVGSVVHMLLMQQKTPVCTPEKIMDKRIPLVLTGKPLAGKTCFCRNRLIPRLNPHPILVIDRLDEYKKLKDVGYDIYGIDFKRGKKNLPSEGKLRFVPNERTEIAKKEVEGIFGHLSMKRKDLSRWIFVIEEAHLYSDIPSFTDFLYASRHYVRKMIVVTPKSDAFRGLNRFVIY